MRSCHSSGIKILRKGQEKWLFWRRDEVLERVKIARCIKILETKKIFIRSKVVTIAKIVSRVWVAIRRKRLRIMKKLMRRRTKKKRSFSSINLSINSSRPNSRILLFTISEKKSKNSSVRTFNSTLNFKVETSKWFRKLITKTHQSNFTLH